MCPSCGKLGCLSCLKRWLSCSAFCPHCRSPLRSSSLVVCRFAAELSTELDRLYAKVASKRGEEPCLNHEQAVLYYCITCSLPICADCALFGDDHKGHSFDHLSKVYDRHVDLIKAEAGTLKRRLKELDVLLHSVETHIQRVTLSKQQRENELRAALEKMVERLDEQLKQKLHTLREQQKGITDEIESLDAMLRDVVGQLEASSKSSLIASSSDMLAMLQQARQKPTNQYTKTRVSSDFVSEIVPSYECGTFCIKNYSEARVCTEVMYSEPIKAGIIMWRLKVYPNGNGVAKGSFLSVFLEMMTGAGEQAKYQYCLEMIHASNPALHIVREFASDFEVGECWGFNRFHRIDQLYRDGFVSGDGEDALTLRFSVRPPTYFQLCHDQKLYIEELEVGRSRAYVQITELKRQLAELKGSPAEASDTPREPSEEAPLVQQNTSLSANEGECRWSSNALTEAIETGAGFPLSEGQGSGSSPSKTEDESDTAQPSKQISRHIQLESRSPFPEEGAFSTVSTPLSRAEGDSKENEEEDAVRLEGEDEPSTPAFSPPEWSIVSPTEETKGEEPTSPTSPHPEHKAGGDSKRTTSREENSSSILPLAIRFVPMVADPPPSSSSSLSHSDDSKSDGGSTSRSSIHLPRTIFLQETRPTEEPSRSHSDAHAHAHLGDK